jgi:actin-related protein 8
MVFRQQQEEALKAQAALLEKEKQAAIAADPMAMDIDGRGAEEGEDAAEQETLGSKVVVIHTGSQNMRLGLASDALPKTFPNVIARKSVKAEYEDEERCPKRVKATEDDDDSDAEDGPPFGEEVCAILFE